MPQLTCENLTVGYDGKKVREDVSFAVERGDYLCIVGENGSGKTTLMKTLLGLQPPVSGKILMGEGLKPTEIGYLPQQTEVQKDFPASGRNGQRDIANTGRVFARSHTWVLSPPSCAIWCRYCALVPKKVVSPMCRT